MSRTPKKNLEDQGSVVSCQSHAIADETDKWARQDANTSSIPVEKHHISEVGAAKGAVKAPDLSFVAAVTGIMALPLTDAEKADAVRRLLGGKNASQCNVSRRPTRRRQ